MPKSKKIKSDCEDDDMALLEAAILENKKIKKMNPKTSNKDTDADSQKEKDRIKKSESLHKIIQSRRDNRQRRSTILKKSKNGKCHTKADNEMAKAVGAKDLDELDKMIEKDNSKKKNKVYEKFAKSYVKKHGAIKAMNSMQDMKENLEKMMCELGPVEAARQMGVSEEDAKAVSQMMRKEMGLDNDVPDADVEELGRRYMAAASYKDIEKRTKIMKEMPTVSEISEEELLTQIDELKVDELEEIVSERWMLRDFEKSLEDKNEEYEGGGVEETKS